MSENTLLTASANSRSVIDPDTLRSHKIMSYSGLFGRSKSEKDLKDNGKGARPKPRNHSLSPVRTTPIADFEMKRRVRKYFDKLDALDQIDIMADALNANASHLLSAPNSRSTQANKEASSIFNSEQLSNEAAIPLSTLHDTASGLANTYVGTNDTQTVTDSQYNFPPYASEYIRKELSRGLLESNAITAVTYAATSYQPIVTNTASYTTPSQPTSQQPNLTLINSQPILRSVPQVSPSTP